MAISAVLIVLIYAGGRISGAHYNPAVTLGMWIRGVIPSADAGVYVVVQVAAAIVASFAVGFTVLAGAYAVGGISGGAFNPAVAVGITMMGASAWGSIWIYLVATLLGAAAAAGVFKARHPGE